MSRRSRKITGSILGALGAVLFIVLSAAGTVFLFWYRTEDNDIAFLILAVTAAVTAFLSLFLVSAGMRLYDCRNGEPERGAGPGRWVRNTLFAGMIGIFLTAAFVTVMETTINGGDTGKVFRFIGLAMIAVAAGISLYTMRAMREARKRRIVNRLAQEAVLNDSGRFSMVVDKVFASKEDKRFAYLGNVHGTMRTGDRVCVIQPDGQTFESTVEIIQREDTVLKKITDNWPQAPILVVLSTDRGGEAFLPYSVLSGTRTLEVDPERNRMEEPALRGYLCAYDEHVGDEKFAGVLLHTITRSRFLVPVVTRDRELRDPSALLPAGTAYQYPTVSSAMLEDSEVIQAYTDWDALSGWGYLMNPSCLQGTKVMTFDEIAAETAEKYTGMVIDPFGPKQFYLSSALLTSLLSRDGEEQETTEE